jgi:hypothetical protein
VSHALRRGVAAKHVDQVAVTADMHLDPHSKAIELTRAISVGWRMLRKLSPLHLRPLWRLPTTSLACRSGDRSGRAICRKDVRVLGADVVEVCVLVERPDRVTAEQRETPRVGQQVP